MSLPAIKAANAAIVALSVSSDPLAWVSGMGSTAQEPPMAFASRLGPVRGVGSRRAAREIAAANDAVIDALARAVVHAMRALRLSRNSPASSIDVNPGIVRGRHRDRQPHIMHALFEFHGPRRRGAEQQQHRQRGEACATQQCLSRSDSLHHPITCMSWQDA